MESSVTIPALSALAALSRLLAQTLTPEQLAQEAVDLLALLLAGHASLTITGGRSATVVHARSTGAPAALDTPAGWANVRPAIRLSVADHHLTASIGRGAGSAYGGTLHVSRPPAAPPFSDAEAALVEAVAAQLNVAFGHLPSRQASLNETSLQAVQALVRAAEMRDPYTAGHSARVSRYASALAHAVGMDEAAIENLRVAALLHDVGKVGISDLILNKPGPLTPEEWACMREHPAMGCQIVQSVQALAPALPLILHHQECYDGSGYPAQLTGEQIPYAARILAVADAFEALTATRAYRRGRSVAEALETLADGAGRQWDADLVGRWHRIIGRLIA